MKREKKGNGEREREREIERYLYLRFTGADLMLNFFYLEWSSTFFYYNALNVNF